METEKQVTFTEMVDETVLSVDKRYKEQPFFSVLKKIDSIFDQLDSRTTGKIFGDYSIDELSRIAGTLAVYRSSLIEGLSFAHRSVSVMNSQLKIRNAVLRDSVKKYYQKNELKFTKDDIESEVDRKMARYVLEGKLYEDWYKKLTNYWFQIADVIGRLDQRIKVMIGDKGTSKYYINDDSEVVPNQPYDLEKLEKNINENI